MNDDKWRLLMYDGEGHIRICKPYDDANAALAVRDTLTKVNPFPGSTFVVEHFNGTTWEEVKDDDPE
jgi:hypothetical protein